MTRSRTTRSVLAAIAYVVLTFPLAIVWHLVVFKDLYERLDYFGDQDPIIPLGLLTIILQGIILAYAYPLMQQGKSTLVDGVRFAVVFGLFMSTTHIIAAAAKHHAPPTVEWFAIEGVFALIQYGLVGTAFAFIHRNPRDGSNGVQP